MARIFLFALLLFGNNLLHAEDLRTRLSGFSSGAHQGGAYHLDHNTLKRFEHARRMGVDIVELDLRLTKDGEVIVFHDSDLNGPTFCKGPVIEKDLSEIMSCKYKFNRQKIPTFREVLEWANGRIVINAEFKVREVIGPAIKLLQEYNAYDWVFFQTKADPVSYQMARDYDRRVALLFAPKNETQLSWALGLLDPELLVIELHEELRTRAVIDRIHNAKKLALEDSWRYVWHKETLKAACDQVFALGIDIAISNAPKSCTKQARRAESLIENSFQR